MELLTAGLTLEGVLLGFVSATPLSPMDCCRVCMESTAQIISQSKFFKLHANKPLRMTHISPSVALIPLASSSQILKVNVAQAI